MFSPFVKHHFNLFSPFLCAMAGPEVFRSNSSSSAMSEAVVPDTMVSPAVYGEKIGGPVLDFSYVGIDAILEQMRRKAMKQGFELNIMVVGRSCLFACTKMLYFYIAQVYPDACSRHLWDTSVIVCFSWNKKFWAQMFLWLLHKQKDIIDGHYKYLYWLRM